MAQTIVLHGKYSGHLRIEYARGQIVYKSDGIPAGSVIYAVQDDCPVPIERITKKAVSGIIVTDGHGEIIMEGRARGTGTNSSAVMKLPHINQTQREKHSAVLDEILERADIVFSDVKTEATEARKVESDKSAFCPFSAMYPDSVWRKVRQRDGRYRLCGTAHIGGQEIEITAIPASFYTEAAFVKSGFIKTAVSDDGTLHRMKVKIKPPGEIPQRS